MATIHIVDVPNEEDEWWGLYLESPTTNSKPFATANSVSLAINHAVLYLQENHGGNGLLFFTGYQKQIVLDRKSMRGFWEQVALFEQSLELMIDYENFRASYEADKAAMSFPGDKVLGRLDGVSVDAGGLVVRGELNDAGQALLDRMASATARNYENTKPLNGDEKAVLIGYAVNELTLPYLIKKFGRSEVSHHFQSKLDTHFYVVHPNGPNRFVPNHVFWDNFAKQCELVVTVAN